METEINQNLASDNFDCNNTSNNRAESLGEA